MPEVAHTYFAHEGKCQEKSYYLRYLIGAGGMMMRNFRIIMLKLPPFTGTLKCDIAFDATLGNVTFLVKLFRCWSFSSSLENEIHALTVACSCYDNSGAAKLR